MRVHGVYMSATAADADPVRFAPVFDAIDDILKRGCVPNGERLILPGIAILAEQSLPTETLVVVRPSWFYLHSDSGRRIQLKPGQILTEIEHGDRWTRVTMGKRIGRVPTRDVRNPYDTRIEAAWAGDRWTIIEFGSGI